MHSEKRTKLRKPSNLLLQIPFDSSRVDRVAEKGGYILTLNKEMFVWLMAPDKSIAQWIARFVRDEETGGSSPLTRTICLTIIVIPLAVLPIISPLPRLLPY